jgi:hypothetical protein
MNANQRNLLWWFTILMCSIIVIITGILAFAGFHQVLAQRGDVFDKVVYENQLKWAVPSVIILTGVLLSGLAGFIGFWFYLRNHE